MTEDRERRLGRDMGLLWLVVVFIVIAAVIGGVTQHREQNAERDRCRASGGTYVETDTYDGFCAAPGSLR